MNRRKPNGYFEKLDCLFAWVSHDTNGEGLCGAMVGQTMIPLVGGDMARIESYREMAVKASGSRPIKLVKFHNVTVLERLNE